MFRTCGVSVVGPYHDESGLPSQDALGIFGGRKGKVLIVSDGMGSKQKSRLGARTAIKSVRKVLFGPEVPTSRELIQNIYRDWLDNLPEGHPSNFGCTLLFALIQADGRATLAQLGDGVIIYKAGKRFNVLTPVKVNFGNQTVGLGISKSWADWHVEEVFLQSPGDGVILMTDGISDDLHPEKIEKFFNTISASLRKTNKRIVRAQLQEQLRNWPTQGHSDDKTIAVISRD